MTTLARKVRRGAARANAKKWEGSPQPTKLLKDGGYVTLRPTKGWLRVSGLRRRAQVRLIAMHLAIGERQSGSLARD